MVDVLDDFDFFATDTDTLQKLVSSVTKFLSKAEAHLAKTVLDLSQSTSNGDDERSTASEENQDKDATKPDMIRDHVEHIKDFLGEELLQKLKEELPTLKYKATGTKKPSVSLFGDINYEYSAATKNLPAQPFHQTIISDVLDSINRTCNTNYNSVLVNRYINRNVALGWHKDDEMSVDSSAPIASLSIGATRLFAITDNLDAKMRSEMIEIPLVDNALLIMKPGLQQTHFHKVDYGRADAQHGECGVRYSLTFRRLIPSTPAVLPSAPPMEIAHSSPESPTLPSAPPMENDETAAEENTHNNCIKCLVFGSSLTKGLKENLLSKRGKNFAVFTNSGARIEDILQDVFAASENKDICRSCIEKVFIISGGNDLENIRSDAGPNVICESYERLLDCMHDIFPSANLNIISPLPRRLRHRHHLDNMISLNDKLSVLCEQKNACKFTDIFTYFLKDRDRFYANRCNFLLNDKLYGVDRLHLSWKGNSVLGKVLIGMTYKPR